jgi:hypothetical protein
MNHIRTEYHPRLASVYMNGAVPPLFASQNQNAKATNSTSEQITYLSSSRRLVKPGTYTLI